MIAAVAKPMRNDRRHFMDSMTSITAKKLMEAYKDYKIRQRVKLRIIPEGKIVQYISCLKISVTSTCNFSTNIFFLNYSGD